MSILHLLKLGGINAERGVKRALEAAGKPIGAVAAPVLEHAAVTLLTSGIDRDSLEHAAKTIAMALTDNLKDYADRQSSLTGADAAHAWRALEWRIADTVAGVVMRTLNQL